MASAVRLAALALIAGALWTQAGAAEARRLPEGMRWGRCHLGIGGQTLISGRCAYEIRKGGEFYIAGPRQVYEGIDYRNPGGFGAGQRSRDYWARVYRDPDGTWQGYANQRDIRSTHADVSFGPLTRRGACLSGQTDDAPGQGGEGRRRAVKVCVWRD